MAYLATHYIANCFRDPQAFAVASTIARANRIAQQLPKYDLYEKAVAKAFFGTLGGAVALNLAGMPEVLLNEAATPRSFATRLWSRISSLAYSITTALSDWLKRHSQVVVYIAGLTFVVSAGIIVYSSWIAPQLGKVLVTVDDQDNSAFQAMGLKPRERLMQQKNDLNATLGDLMPPIMPTLPLCQVCKEAPPSFACTACGNLVLCGDHVEKYTSTFGLRCPICRVSSLTFLQIRIPGIGSEPKAEPKTEPKTEPAAVSSGTTESTLQSAIATTEQAPAAATIELAPATATIELAPLTATIEQAPAAATIAV